MIEVNGLSKSFGSVKAVDDLNFKVKDGEVFGYLGPNGAGKTTTVRMLCCLLKPDSGSALINGYYINKEPDKIRSLIGLLPEVPGFYNSLSLVKNLLFYSRLQGINDDKALKRINDYLNLLGLKSRKDDALGSFSKGMQQKVAIIRALIHEPKYLFLDEPTASLDPQAAKTVRDFIIKLKEKNRVIFINTHNLSEAQRICDRVAVLNKKVLSIGSPKELSKTLFKPKTVIKLSSINNRLKNSLKGCDFEVKGDELIFNVNDPIKDNPLLVKKIVKSGGRILSVNESEHSLEDVYLKLVGETK